MAQVLLRMLPSRHCLDGTGLEGRHEIDVRPPTGDASSRRDAGFADPLPGDRRYHHPDFDKKGLEGWRAVHREAALSHAAWKAEREWAVRMGLPGAESIEDRSISTFARGELPHYAGINTFLKAPYVEMFATPGSTTAAILGAPFDGGTTFRPGTRFGPQAIRRISALYTPYNFEIGGRSPRADDDVRPRRRLYDPGQSRKNLRSDQPGRGTCVLAGGVADHSRRRPLDRLSDDARHRAMHLATHRNHSFRSDTPIFRREGPRRADATTPWFHATNLPNVPASNLVQIGIGGWQVPREAVAVARERDTTIITMSDVENLGIDKTAEIALEIAWKDAGAVYMSFDIDSVDCGFVPGNRMAGTRRFPAARGIGAGREGGERGALRNGNRRSVAALTTPRTSPPSSPPASLSTRSARSWRMASLARISPSSTSQWRSEMRSAAPGPGHNTLSSRGQPMARPEGGRQAGIPSGGA